MNRLLSLAVIGTAFGSIPAANAQPRGGPPPRNGRPAASSGDELERLRTQVKELEEKLAAERPSPSPVRTRGARG